MKWKTVRSEKFSEEEIAEGVMGRSILLHWQRGNTEGGVIGGKLLRRRRRRRLILRGGEEIEPMSRSRSSGWASPPWARAREGEAGRRETDSGVCKVSQGWLRSSEQDVHIQINYICPAAPGYLASGKTNLEHQPPTHSLFRHRAWQLSITLERKQPAKLSLEAFDEDVQHAKWLWLLAPK